jgi:hypothetical protein
MIRSITQITKALGEGNSNLSIISSASLALISFFYIYAVSSYFQVGIYILENRVTYYKLFSATYIISEYVDNIIIASGTILWLALSIRGRSRFGISAIYSGLTIIAVLANLRILFDIIALMSIPVIISFLIYNKFAYKKVLYINASLSINYLALIGIATGIGGIIISSAPLFSISPTSIPIRNYAHDIFLLASSFSPVLMLLLILCFPVKILVKEFITGILKFKNNKPDLLISNYYIKLRIKIIYLSLFTLLSITLALIPTQPTINKDNQQISVDTGVYVNWVDKLLTHSNDFQEFIRQAFVIQSAGDRPIVLIFLFTIVKIVNANIFYTIEHVPLILGPALILVIYFLTRELTSNDITSLIASFLTAISFHTLIGIYAGFYANWFALIIGYLSFVFLIRFLKKPRKLNLLIYFTLMVLLLFSHTYTWTLLAIVMGVFLVIMLAYNYYNKKSVILLLLVVLSSVVIDTARTAVTGQPGGIERDIYTASIGGAGLEHFAVRWSNLVDTTQIYSGGLFSNFIIIMLGLYWLFRSNLNEPSSIFLLVFLSIGVIPLFIGNWAIQTRIFYDIPFQIPAAIALTYVKKQFNGTMILLPICIWLIAMSIRAVTNFYLILRS